MFVYVFRIDHTTTPIFFVRMLIELHTQASGLPHSTLSLDQHTLTVSHNISTAQLYKNIHVCTIATPNKLNLPVALIIYNTNIIINNQ